MKQRDSRGVHAAGERISLEYFSFKEVFNQLRKKLGDPP
jgi:hypothetical protein